MGEKRWADRCCHHSRRSSAGTPRSSPQQGREEEGLLRWVGRLSISLALVAAFFVGGPIAAQEPESRPASEPTETPATPFDFSGYLSLSFRGRSRGSSDDQDLYGYVSLDGGNPEINDLSFHLFGRGTYDLDGDAGLKRNLFGSSSDVFGNSLDLDLYQAYVELRRSWAPEALGIERVRIGRQQVYGAYSYLMDGGRIDFQEIKEAARMRISIFGGIPELLNDRSRSGDWLAGAEVEMRPFDTTRVEMRYVHAEDRNDFGGTKYRAQDEYASLALWQRIGDNGSVWAEWTTIEARTRGVALRASWEWPKLDLSVRGSYRYQNDIEKQFTPTYDPYVTVLGTSFAYHNFQIDASKLFGKHFGIDAGFSGRVLDDHSRNAPFNREFGRGWLTLSAYDWPAQNIDIALTGEYWGANDDETASAGVEVIWRPKKSFRITAGSYYSLYKYDLFIVDERLDATTVFLKLRWNIDDALRVDARYEFETGDEGDFHSVWVGLRWRF